MSRLLQVVIALVGLAITGVLGLASGRSEALQARHTLIGLFTQTVSAARANCDQGLAQMAVGALQQLESLEADRLVLTPRDRRDKEQSQTLLANYQDYMAEVQGTIDSGACLPGGVLTASNEAATGSGPGALSGPAPNLPSSSVLGRIARDSNIELRRAEEQMQAQVQAQPPAPADDAAAPAADGTPTRGMEDAEVRARAQLRPANAYYAVLASYDVSEPSTYDPERGVVAHYRQLRQAVDGANVRVFKTGATNRFAIVVASDGAGSRIDARRQVANARARGWSPEALVQPAYDWTECAQPERITRQSGCVAR